MKTASFSPSPRVGFRFKSSARAKFRALAIGCLLCFGTLAFGQFADNEALKGFVKERFAQRDHSGCYQALKDLVNDPARMNGLSEPYVRYAIGRCLLESDVKDRSVPFFAYAYKFRDEHVGMELYYYFGRAYHYEGRFGRALEMFDRYIDEASTATDSKQMLANARRMIAVCQNARDLYEAYQADTAQSQFPMVRVDTVGLHVSSYFSEDSPVFLDGAKGILFASNRIEEPWSPLANDYIFLPDSLRDRPTKIYSSTREGYNWRYPEPLALMDDPYVMPLSVSASGEELLLFAGKDETDGHLYISARSGSKWGKPKKIGNRLYSRNSVARGATFSANGRIIYFSSNLAGGYGGFDLYMTRKDGSKWTEPKNLGPTVNSTYDEVYPFMDVDGRTLYFSSDGYNAMGGLDIFKSVQEATGWTEPENLGYPINSTYDDRHYVVVVKDKIAYFSSDRPNGLGSTDIHYAYWPETPLNLSMVRGQIKAFDEEGQKLPVTIEVTDGASGKRQRYVYSPAQDTDEYFMILVKGRAYKMNVQIGDRHTQTVDLVVPDSTYAYTLDERIEVQPVLSGSEQIGTTMSVSEASWQIVSSEEGSPEAFYEEALFQLMEQIIIHADMDAMASLDEWRDQIDYPKPPVPGEPDPLYDPLFEQAERIFNDSTTRDEAMARLETLGQPLDTAYKQTVYYLKEAKTEEDRKLLWQHTVSFEPGQFALSEEEEMQVRHLAELVKASPKVYGLEVCWLSADGAEPIDALTQRRLQSIYEYLGRIPLERGQYAQKRYEVGESPGSRANLELRVYFSR